MLASSPGRNRRRTRPAAQPERLPTRDECLDRLAMVLAAAALRIHRERQLQQRESGG